MIKGRSKYGGGTGGDVDLRKRENPIAPLDSNVEFDESVDPRTKEIRHDYWMHDEFGEWVYLGSCTGEIKLYLKNKGKFDAGEVWDKNMANGSFKKPESKHFGRTRQEFIDWCDGASVFGTAMHKQIELFMNDCADTKSALWTTDPDVSPALKRFLCCWAMEFDGKLYPFRTELNIWHRACEFAGQADLIFRRDEWDSDPRKALWLGIGDWKRSNKNLEERRAYQDEHMIGLCESLPATAHSKFCLQMSLYALVMMMRTKYVVVELFVGQFHHDHDNYVWKKFEPIFDIVKEMLLARRTRMLAKYTDSMKKRLVGSERAFSQMANAPNYAGAKDERYEKPQALKDAAAEGNTTAEMALQMRDLARDARALSSLLQSETTYGSRDVYHSAFAREIDAAIAKYREAIEYMNCAKSSETGSDVQPKKRAREEADTIPSDYFT